MKKIIIAAMALAMAAPAATTALADDDRWERKRERWEHRAERRHDRWERRHDRRRDRDHHRYYSYRHAPVVRYYAPPVRYYVPAPTYNYYAPPPAYGYYGGGYYHQPRWSRGQVLPYSYRRYVVNNYYDYGWSPPPYGHAYYRTDGGNVVLAAIATGLILSAFAGAF